MFTTKVVGLLRNSDWFDCCAPDWCELEVAYVNNQGQAGKKSHCWYRCTLDYHQWKTILLCNSIIYTIHDWEQYQGKVDYWVRKQRKELLQNLFIDVVSVAQKRLPFRMPVHIRSSYHYNHHPSSILHAHLWGWMCMHVLTLNHFVYWSDSSSWSELLAYKVTQMSFIDFFPSH